MSEPRGWLEWDAEQAGDWIAVPRATDDKYTRGVLGVLTGGHDYPGAAVLGVEAAMRTGVGMVRYLGPPRAADFVLARRPEVVTVPGRVQAWLLGSGMNADQRDEQTTAALRAALAEGLPTVCDAGALDLARGWQAGPLVITPHYRELARLLSQDGMQVTGAQVAADPGDWATRAAAELGVTVLLKGSVTRVVSPSGPRLTVSRSPVWLATAGSGDVLGGIIGALLATHAAAIRTDAEALTDLAATAARIHSLAAIRASAGGPITALDVAEAVPATVAALLGHTPPH
ncbi:NAD(P)H-hydrate dehydratase [Cryobacterium sp. TMT1-21]|uniref:ADP-dependent (S)-NAD(P)H-hydrate dehydratase n=1 Tax=Cryobacterium shii TaxID=1259235 RepID=A0AAQ2C3Y8_9MICO|nr:MULTISPECIES: ADP/ATP-dependent (S)-NAD(P)H-hydrate dehydratase [Cryobacterium]TFC42465.1 NAD(P)H-hydrate dehydratase [Cryobacterium shii]TFC80797.1 NAD(P)H-hydrate dehydratase [Cryobacterium sp. TmT2-59]TFD14151.1 NAD(P)H-hydrate dehydratase [Cryobacterium sp. TMT1-21]TFD18696.1 NAD(P)H-hydrate dehydratase [Cryobacterium sp. TMT4-10]TFD28498.1 NAD(P)H-hydrate dehydratase [Cryobacterium sp. TMT2-23]